MNRVCPIALIAFAVLVSGCAAGYRVGVGPTVDTRGRVGVNVTLTGYLGVADDDGDGVGFVLVQEAAAGAQFNPTGPAVHYGTGFDVIHTEDEELDFRGGLRLHARWVYPGDVQEIVTASAEAVGAGSFGPLHDYHLSVELRGGIAQDTSFPDSAPLGTFGLSLVYDRLTIGNPLDGIGGK